MHSIIYYTNFDPSSIKSIITMKLKAILICLLALVANLHAQTSAPLNNFTKGTISGKVVEKKNNEAIPYASVTIKEDGKIITGGMTKENGSFTLSELPLKNVNLEIVFMGYKKYETTVSLSLENKNIQLKNIALEEEDAKRLEDISIVKEKSTVEQKIDRKVITVGKDLVTAGATAADIMNNIPSVSIDQQNNTISLRGNENVRIFIDGKPSNLTPMQALQQIPTTSIKQIELITNPSAKYNPEGMSGIINIVLNKNANLGFNGNVNTGVNFGKTPKGNASLDMNYRVNKLNFYTSYSLNNGQQRNRGLINWIDSYNVNNNNTEFNILNFNKNHFGKIGVDFYINDKNTISFYTMQSFFKGNGRFRNDIDFLTGPLTDRTQLQYGINDSKNATYNVAYKLKTNKPEETLDFEINYNANKNPEDSKYYDGNNNLLFTNQVSNQGFNVIANVDYVNPINETTKIELGVESRFDGTDNQLNQDFLYNSDLDYRRNIQSAYMNYGKHSKKWDYQLGIRLESYSVEANFRKVAELPGQFKDYIFTAYPSAFVTYTASEKNSFNFSVSRRVDRPNLDQVNPIREWTSPTIDQIGNTNLKPQFTNSVEANYTRKLKTGSITAGTFVRFIKNDITQVIYTSPLDVNKKLLTFTNFDANTEYGLEVSGNLDFIKWWNLNFGTDIYFKNVQGTVEDKDGNLFTDEVLATPFNARMNHTFKLNKDLRLTWFTMYSGAAKGLQFSNRDMWKTDLGARYNILKGKGTISIRYNDLFNKMRARFYSTNPDQIDGQFRWESRTFNVNFSYRFGSGKDRALQRKQREKNESQGGGLF